MTVQTEYTKEAGLALPGLIYDVGNTNIDSFAVEAAAIPFGRFVSRGSDDENQVVLGGATSIGVSVRTAGENDYNTSLAKMEYGITDTAGVLRSGFIWCEFDALGGSVDAAVTINGTGQIVAAGGGTALTAIAATVEKSAVSVMVGTTEFFVGLINVKG